MANLTNSAKLIEEMEKKAYKTELPTVNNATVTVAVNGNTWTNSFTTNQASNSTLKITVGKSDVGLWNVDNTSDADKPISTATQTALDWKQATISDLSTIRTWAWKWATAVQPWDNISTLTNNSWFITKAVNDLTNYYTKTDTYTKTEVNSLVQNFQWFEIVATLPTTNIKTNVIYLKWPSGSGTDQYEEYVYSSNAWVKIWDTSVDLTNYFNKSTNTSDNITQGSTNLFLTSTERTKLSNTSGTNTGDETKTTIQSKLGTATSSNDWYLTSVDWTMFNNKADAADVNTKMFPLPVQGANISEIISQLNNWWWVLFYVSYSDELATVVGNRYYLVIDYDMQSWVIKAKWDFSNATITLTSWTTTVASVITWWENVKKFSLSSTSDTTTAEKIVDWYNWWNIPVIVYDSVLYVFHNYQYSSQNGKSYYTFLANTTSTDGTSTSSLINNELVITYNPDAVFQYSINTFNEWLGWYLKTWVNYSTPYTPQYDWSPVTKKYVDDKSATVMTASEYSQVSDPIAWKLYFIKKS